MSLLSSHLLASFDFQSDATDSTGGQNGTLVNSPTFVTANVGNGMDCDVTAQSHAVIAHADAATWEFGTNHRTVEVWCRPASLPTSGNGASLVRMGSSSSSDVGWHVIYNNNAGTGQFIARLADGTTLYTATASGYPADGSDYHVVASYNRTGSLFLFVNGVNVASTSISAASAVDINSDDDVRFGGLHQVYYDGIVDQVRLWDFNISSDGDLANWLYNGGDGRDHAAILAFKGPWVRSRWTAVQASNTTNLASPVGFMKNGDLVIHHITTDGDTSASIAITEAGFSELLTPQVVSIGSNPATLGIWSEVIDSDDKYSTINATWTGNERATSVTIVVSNAGVIEDVDTEPTSSGDTTPPGPTITVTNPGITIYGVGKDQEAAITSPPTGVLVIGDQGGGTSASTRTIVGRNRPTASGTFGPLDWTFVGGNNTIAFGYHIQSILNILPSSISSGEAFGTSVITQGGGQSVTLTGGIASAEAFGSHTVTTGSVSVAPSSIASAEAFGGHTITAGVVVLSPGGVEPAEAFGTHTITTGVVDVSPNSIISTEAFGNHTLTVGTFFIFPDGVASAEVFGDCVVTTGNVDISPDGIASAEAFGDHVLTVGSVAISPDGIASLESFGDHVLTTGEATVSPDGVASLEAFGTLLITLAVSPTAIGSDEAFGSHTVVAGGSPQSVLPGSITSEEAFGTAVITPVISPEGIVSAEAFGTPFFTLAITLTGISSAEAFGTPIFVPVLVPSGIASAEVVGDLTVTSTVDVAPSSIASLEAFGTPSFVERIIPTGIPTSEAFGTPSLGSVIVPTGIASTEGFGTPFVGHINPVGIASAGAFGVFRVTVYVSPSGVSSGEAFGTPILLPFIAPEGIASVEAFGTPVVLGSAPLTPTGIASAEAFGTPTIVPELIIQAVGISSAENIPRPVVADAAALIAWVNEDLAASVGQTNFNIAINVPDTSPKNILGFLIDISYDTNLLTISGHSTVGTLTASGWTVISSFPSPGIVRVVGAAATPLTGSGVLVNLVVASADAPGSSNLNFSQILWNEGTPPAVADGGDILISTTGITVPFVNGGETFGTPTVTTSSVAIAPTGIASVGVVSEPTVSRGFLLLPTGITSAEAFGVVTFGNNGLVIPSIQAGEQFGTPSVSRRFPLTEPIRVIIVTENRDYAISIETNNKQHTATLTRNLT